MNAMKNQSVIGKAWRMACAHVKACVGAAAVMAGCIGLVAPAAGQTPGPVVISQVYGGGNNSGAVYRHDYVELFNRSCVPVDISTWSIQQASVSGTTWARTNIPVGTVLQPGQYFLMQFTSLIAGVTPVGVDLPVAPDAYSAQGSTGSNIGIAAANGKIALVRNQAALPSVTCPNSTFSNGVVDMVTFGTGGSACEGTVVPTITSAQSIVRKLGGCTDTNVNSADFTVQTATAIPPRNMSTTLAPCGGTGTAGFGACTVAATGACTILSPADCLTAGGTYAECTACPARGACCTGNGICTITLPAECSVAGGSFAGPNTACYTITTGSNLIETITTPTTGPTGDDGVSSVITLPFTFVYYGVNQTQLSYNTNGLVAFGGSTSTAFSDLRFPNIGTPNNVFAALWDDFSVDASASTQHGVNGTAPNRRFVISWTNDLDLSTGGARYTFQVLLFEGTNQIEFRYGTFTQPVTQGDFSIGIENSSGTVGQYRDYRTITSNSSLRWAPNACPLATGACCVSTTCSITNQVACTDQSGNYQGNNTLCSPNPCTPPGACCSASGTCVPATLAACTLAGNFFQGEGVACASNPCPAGACCLTSGTCVSVIQASCTAQGGFRWSSGGSCTPNPCMGRCCTPGNCTVTLESNCPPASYAGDGTTCSNSQTFSQTVGLPLLVTDNTPAGVTSTITVSPAFPIGKATVSVSIPAHTFIGDLTLSITHGTTTVMLWDRSCGTTENLTATFDDAGAVVNCSPTSGGTGQGTIKTTGTGAGLLSAFIGQNSTGTWTLFASDSVNGDVGSIVSWSVTLSSSASPCTGACCIGTNCSVLSGDDCFAATGTYQGIGATCSPNPCVTGSCCLLDGNCSVLLAAQCASSNGFYQGDNTLCGQTTCPATGACCNGASCSVTFQANCGFVWTTGQSCTPANYCQGACCDTSSLCTLTVPSGCLSPSNFQGQGTTCTPTNFCVARCCMPDGSCTVISPASCTTAGGLPGSLGTTCPAITYTVTSLSNTLEDISAGAIAGPTGDDNPSANITLPFTFYYFGAAKTQVGYSTNGLLQFTTGVTTASTAFTNPTIPNSATPNDIICPLWDDLFVDGPAFTRHNIVGTAPFRRLVVEWNQIREISSGNRLTFQAILYEGSNNIEYRYQTYFNETTADDYSIGVEDSAGATGTALTPLQKAAITNGSSRLFSPAGMICAQPTGGCCVSTTCSVISYAACQVAGGSFQGYGASCSPNPCTPPGACCAAGGSCTSITAGACAFANGYFLGEGVACSPTPCPTGACCLNSGTCVVDIQADCTFQGGFRWTNGGSCSPNLCVGRCCAGDGTCTVTTQSACSGRYGGDGTSCVALGTAQNFPSDDPALPLAIPDNTPAGVTSSFNVGPSFAIGKATVTVSIPAHTFIGDLIVRVTHGATTVTLWNATCGGADGLTATFDDAAAATTCNNAPQGTIAPSGSGAGPLSGFNGALSDGAWTLFVSDNANQDLGSLVSWSVTLTPVVSPCQGACCVAGTCQVLSSDACALLAGANYKGDTTVCSSYPAPGAPGSVSVDTASYCSVGGPATITLSASCSSGTLNWYSGSCGGTFVGTGSPLVIAAPGASTTYFARCETDCGYSACGSVDVTVTTGATANAGSNQTICANGTATMSGSASGFTTTAWSTSGDGSFDDPGNLSAIYTPGANDVSTGSVILTLTAGATAPCLPAVSSLTLTIQGQPTAVAGSPLTAGGCMAFPVSLNGVVTNASSSAWTTDGTGSFADASSPVTTYTISSGDVTAGVVHLTLTANAIFPCTGSVTSVITLNVVPPPHTAFVDDGYLNLAPGTSVNWPYTGVSGPYTIGCDAFASIQAGLNAVVASTVNVAPGTYDEDLTISLVNTNLVGSGAGVTTIRGVFGGSGSTIAVAASNVTISGLTITRLGNNVADWNNANGVLNSAGVSVQGSHTNMVLRDCVLSGNRSGIDINNSSGHTIRNCVIDNNRTGLIFRNQTDNITFTQNKVTNNWTVGVLFLDGSGGTNSPVQTAANCSFTNNDISGNWYGQVVDRQVGGSLPAPGTNLKNFSGNWLGSTSPAVSNLNSTEPGYAAQIPVVFGGTAVPPGGQPDVLGPASANLDITPLLGSGTDTDISTGFGTNGFQGGFDALTVTSELAQTGSTGRVQEAHDAINAGGTVSVNAGSYTDNVVITKRLTIDGAGSGTCASGSDPLTQTVVTAASPAVPVFTISDVGGSSPVNRLTLRDMRITGGGSGMAGVLAVAAPAQTRSYFTFDNLALASNGGPGLEFNSNGGGFSDMEVLDSSICSNYQGIVTHTTLNAFDGLSVTGCEVRDNAFNGVAMYGSTSSGFNPTNITVSNSQFSNNGQSSNLYQGSGDLSFFEFNGNASIQNVSVNTSGRVPVQFRGRGTANTATWLPSGIVSINGLTVTGAADRPAMYIQTYSDVTGISLNNVDVSGITNLNPPFTAFSVAGLILDHTGATPLELGNTIFSCPGGGYASAAVYNTGGAHASCSTVFGLATTVPQKEACVFDGDDVFGFGQITFDNVNIVAQPTGGAVCQGMPFVFTVSVTGAGPFSYQWYRDATPVGTDANFYIIGAAGLGDAGNYHVDVTNTCGTVSSASVSLSITPLPVAPSSASSSDSNVCPGGAGSITLSATGGSGVTLQWFTGSCGGTLIGTGSPLVIGAPLSDTTYYARWITPCGASACESVTVTVSDTINPTILGCPTDIDVNNDAGLCTAAVTWTPPTANDNCPGVMIAGNFNPGHVFPYGPTTVTYTATDASNNTAICSFTVTVHDNELPVIHDCPSNITVTATGGACTAVANWTAPTITDNCPGATINGSHTSGSSFPVGVTTVTYTGTDAHSNAAVPCVFTVTVLPDPFATDMYVDDDYIGLPIGTSVNFPFDALPGPYTIGCNAFATIQGGIDATPVGGGGIVNVAAGTYLESPTINKTMSLVGPNAGVDPCTGTRVAEAIVMPASGAATLAGTTTFVSVTADGVVIDGLTLDGDNPALTSPFTANLANPDADVGISAETAGGGDGLIIRNNIIKNIFQFGVALGSTGGPARAGNVNHNSIQNVPYWAGVLVYDDYYADIHNNCMQNVWRGVQTNNFHQARPGNAVSQISNNTITTQTQAIAGDLTYTDVGGILVNLHYQNATAWDVNGNTITNTSPSSSGSQGVFIWSIQTAVAVVVADNIVNDFERGCTLWNCPTTTTVDVSDNSFSGGQYGVVATNYDAFGDAASSKYSVFTNTISGAAQAGVLLMDDPANTNGATVAATVYGNSVSACDVGLKIDGATSLAAANLFAGNASAGVAVLNGGIADLGQCSPGTDVTGLGVSSGGNDLSGYGFDAASPYAIINTNSSGESAVYAANNAFGAVAGDNISLALSGNGGANSSILYDQSGVPIFTTQPTAITTCAGSNIVFTSLAYDISGYQWNYNGGPILGQTGASLAINGVTTSDSGNYSVTITDLCGNQTTSNVVGLTVNVGPSITVPPTGGAVCAGQPFVFSVTAGGTAPLSYQWRLNGFDIGGATSNTYSIASATASDAGSYDVVVTNICGTTTSTAVSFTVNPLPVAPSSAASSPSGYCTSAIPGTISLSAIGGSGDTLQWFSGSCGGTPVGTGSPLVITAPVTTTTYHARWTNACGDSLCADVTVTVTTAPATPVAGSDLTSPCPGTPVTLSATAGVGETIDWYTGSCGGSLVGSGLTLSVNPFTTTTYYARARNTGSGCYSSLCDDQTVTVTNIPPSIVFVDDDYTGMLPGTPVNFPDNGAAGPHTIGCDAFATIQGGVNAVVATGTVNVAAGNYSEDVNVNKTVSILGAGPGSSIVTGPIGGAGSTFQFTADGVTLAGFTITRDGNTVAQWNLALNTAGVGIQSRTSGTVRDCLITGNRTGIDINNSNGISVHNNVIDNNRTGLIFRNVTDNCSIFENSIADNWTAGVLFLNLAPSPQSANGTTIDNNSITNNWYADIQDRMTTAAPKNFSGNWYGTTNPVITNTDTTEPGYAAQIPTVFGGGATPPGGAPDVAGAGSANIDITPMLNSGVDTDVDNGTGIYGFQGNFNALTVTSQLAQTGSTGRVQEGHDLVTVGGLVNVTTGSFSENIVITKEIELVGSGGGACADALNPATQTILTAANPALPAVTINDAGGASAVSRLAISQARITGSSVSGIRAFAASGQTRSHFTFDALTITGNGGAGLYFDGPNGGFSDVDLTDSELCGNYRGVYSETSLASFDGFNANNDSVHNNVFHGMAFYGRTTPSGYSPTNISISNSTFASNGQSNNLYQGSGDLSFFEFNGNASLTNVAINTTGRFPIQFLGRGGSNPVNWLPTGTMIFNNVDVSGAADRAGITIVQYSDVSAVSLSGVDLSGMSSLAAPFSGFATVGMQVQHTGAVPLELNNTIFPCQGGQGAGYVGLSMLGTGGAHASCSTIFVGASTLAQKENCVFDQNDLAAVGDVTFDDVVIVSQPMGGAVCAGTPFNFTVSAGGVGPFSYQWYQGITPVGINSNTYAIASTTAGDAGSYTVVITNACGSVTSAAAVLAVNANPVAPSSASSDVTTFCFDQSPGTITLTAVGGSGSVLNWYSGSCGGAFVGTGAVLNTAAPLATTTYFARWETGTCGVSTCASVTVTVNANPPAATAAAASPTTLCDTGIVMLTASVGGGQTVDWYTGSCGGTLVGSGSPFSTTVSSTTTFYARARNTLTGCYSAACDSTTVTVYPSPTAPSSASSSSTSYCEGSLTNITLSASGGSGDTLKWYSGSCGGTLVGVGSPLIISAPSVSTTYYARWETANCGNSTCASVAVSVQAQPTVNAGGPYTICEGGVALLSGASTGASSVAWTTSGSGIFVDPSSAVTIYHPSPADITAGSVTLTLTANATFPCTGSVSSPTTLTILPKPVAPTSAASSNNNYCTGSLATISLSATGGSGTKLAWHEGSCGGTIIGAGSPLNIPAPTVTTTYYANWINSCGASTCVAVTVTVIPNPVAPASVSSSQVAWCAGSGPSNITLSASGGSGDTFQWFTGSCGGTSIGTGTSLVLAAPSSTTTYYGRWHNTCGDSTCAAVTVTVNPLPVAPSSASVDAPAYCAGVGPANITLTAVGGSGDVLKWYNGSCGGSLVGMGTTLVTAAPGSTTTYFARWETASCGNSTCQSVTVTVNPQAVAPTSVTSTANNYCSTSVASITLEALGGMGDTLEWFSGSCGGTPVGTGTPLTITAPLVTTTYYARWTNGCGPSTCASLEVVVTPVAGACCSGWGTNKMCHVVPPSMCNPSPTPAGAYRGDCTTCTPTSCCPADFNNNGMVSVQDIFDFLQAYFDAGNTTTGDYNNNLIKSPQDLFDFLAAYFAGC